MGVLVGDGQMPVAPTPIRNRRQRSGVTVLSRYLSHHILACPRLTPNMGEAEEGEGGTVRLWMVSPIWSVVAKINEARLVGWSVSPYRARRLPNTPRTRLASRNSSNAITASSANRTRVHLPLSRGRTSSSNHSSSTWCRKMFERGKVRSHRLVGSLRSRGAGGHLPGRPLSATYQSSVG